MGSINTMLMIDVVIVILGIYLLFLSVRMKKSKKVERFIIPEETLKQCKQEEELAKYLSVRMMAFSIVLSVGGALMVVHETLYNMGYGYYFIVAIITIAFCIFYKQLADGKAKYC